MRPIMWYLIGAVIGGYAGKLIAEEILEREAIEKEIAEEEKLYEETVANLYEIQTTTGELTDLEERVEGRIVKELFDVDSRTERRKKHRKPVDYTKFLDDGSKRQRKPLAEVVAERIPEENDLDDPYFISQTEFENGKPGYGTEVLLFYARDSVLTNDEKVVVDDPVELIGPHGLDEFGRKSEDEDSAFVVNPVKGIIYQVVRLHESHSESSKSPLVIVPEVPVKKGKSGKQAA